MLACHPNEIIATPLLHQSVIVKTHLKESTSHFCLQSRCMDWTCFLSVKAAFFTLDNLLRPVWGGGLGFFCRNLNVGVKRQSNIDIHVHSRAVVLLSWPVSDALARSVYQSACLVMEHLCSLPHLLSYLTSVGNGECFYGPSTSVRNDCIRYYHWRDQIWELWCVSLSLPSWVSIL